MEGTQPSLKKINAYVENSLMLVTDLSPVIGYDKASRIAHFANDNDHDLTLEAGEADRHRADLSALCGPVGWVA